MTALEDDDTFTLTTVVARPTDDLTDADVYRLLTTPAGETPETDAALLRGGPAAERRPGRGVAELLETTALVAADDHWKTELRDPNTGRWVDGPTAAVADAAQTAKRLVPAQIYKKHADGTVVATSRTGDRRLRWDAGRKKFIAEDRAGDAWSESEALGKGQAYEQVRKSDIWHEPVRTGTKAVTAQLPRSAQQAPAVVEPSASRAKITTTSTVPTIINPKPLPTGLPPDVADRTQVRRVGDLAIGAEFAHDGRRWRVTRQPGYLTYATDVYGEQEVAFSPSRDVYLPRVAPTGPLGLEDALTELAAIRNLARHYAEVDAEISQKAGTGKVLKPDDLKAGDHAHRALRALRVEAEPHARAVLHTLIERDGAPWGSLDTPEEMSRWSAATKPVTTLIAGTDTAKWQKIRDEYVVNDAKTIKNNASVRSGQPTLGAKSWATRVSNAARAGRVTHDSLVYRGAAFLPEMVAQLRPGATLVDPGVMSTDESHGSANAYAGTRLDRLPGALRVLFTIRVPAGTPGADVSYGEFIFPTGTGLRVVSSKMDDDGVVHVVADMLPPTPTSKKVKK